MVRRDEVGTMRTHLTLEYDQPEPLPSEYEDEVRTPPVLVERLLREFTDPGDVVLDPFAGFGTTLRVAADLGRVPRGVEYEADRVGYVRGRLDDPDAVVCGDALELASLDLPGADCCLTSPPFAVEGMAVDPLRNYALGTENDYEGYLDDVRGVFASVADLLSPGDPVLVDVSNLERDGEVTTLAWDLADALDAGSELRFEGEVVVGWEADDPGPDGAFGYGYDHSYCLVFRV